MNDKFYFLPDQIPDYHSASESNRLWAIWFNNIHIRCINNHCDIPLQRNSKMIILHWQYR